MTQIHTPADVTRFCARIGNDDITCEIGGCDEPAILVSLHGSLKALCQPHVPAFLRARKPALSHGTTPARTALDQLAHAVWQVFSGRRDSIAVGIVIGMAVAGIAPGFGDTVYRSGARQVFGDDPDTEGVLAMLWELIARVRLPEEVTE